MTIQQLEQRLSELERQIAEIRSQVKSSQPATSVQETFRVFADDPVFDEIVELGREYRAKANADELGGGEEEC